MDSPLDFRPALAGEPLQIGHERGIFAVIHCDNNFSLSVVFAPGNFYGVSFIETLGRSRQNVWRCSPNDEPLGGRRGSVREAP
jgi:hypothetical protein